MAEDNLDIPAQNQEASGSLEGQDKIAGEQLPQKRGPGRQKGWRKNKTVEPPTAPPDKNDIDIAELDRLLTERTQYAEPNLADSSSSPKIETPISDDPRFKVPTEIQEPLAGQIIQRAHTTLKNEQIQGTDGASIAQTVVPEMKFETPPVQPAVTSSETETKTPAATTSAPVKPKNPEFEAKSPAERKKEVAKTADMYLKGYQQVFPMPFKWVSKFNVGKLDKMHMQGAIDLNMLIAPPSPDKPTGTSLKDYVVKHNADVENIFVIPDQWIEDLRPHLEDVLMEKEVAHTPMERLIGALIPQILTFGQAAAQMFQTQRMATKEMQSMAAEQKRKNDLMEQAIRNGTYVRPIEYRKNPSEGNQQQHQATTQPVQQTPAPAANTAQNSVTEVTNNITHEQPAPPPPPPAPAPSDEKEKKNDASPLKVEEYISTPETPEKK